jgi:hypothetical protein
MKWQIEIIGENNDLEELSKSLNVPQLTLEKAEGKYYLTSSDFAGVNNAEEIMEKSKNILRLVNGSAYLTLGMRRPLETSHIVKTMDDGSRQIFMYFSDGIRVGDKFEIVVNGKAVQFREANVIPGWVHIAENDKSVTSVLRLYGLGKQDWVNLYRIFEIIKTDSGGEAEIIKEGWATNSTMNRFTHTANSPSILGDEARHGAEQTAPPKHPMTFDEAKSFVESITHYWLNTKTNIQNN